MPSTENQSSSASSSFSSFGRSLFGIRQEQVHSVEVSHESDSCNLELGSFQKRVTDRFHDLSVVSDDELLSIDWMQKLLTAFICCHEEFRAIMLNNKEEVSKPPLDRMTSEFIERSVKALDICNASRDGIENIRMWQKHLEIASCALGSNKRPLSEGQFRRARKALMDLALAMLDEKESGSVFSQRHRSFGRHNTSKDHSPGHSRSHSWSVSRSWSAAKQLQSIANNLVPPRANDIAANSRLSVSVYTMNCVLLFVLWILVAAIPCQDRGLNLHFSVPRQFTWSTPVTLLHERILEESKKRERRNSSGLLKEIYQIEVTTRHLTDLVDSAQFPLTETYKLEVEQDLKELKLVLEAFRDGLDPLECLVREVFRKIVICRTEGLDSLGASNYTGQ
ncbi:protein BYPASS1-LIKE-like [Vicia villosa]|uniref:protein BYPASS1-LIKE-like n=1 Tax=Vicia villosa TaxID=3911 RepID=UPI00273B1107|nr:protein BYPASS1-LIKE-like [Vicia villosa]XP_058735685.1 protein BYPASS1-LIKE-like [Vicia villosa]